MASKKVSKSEARKVTGEITGLEAPSGLAVLLEREDFLQKAPHLILASPKSIGKIKAFLLFKPPKTPWFELPPFPRSRSAAAERAWPERIRWQTAARRQAQNHSHARSQSHGIFLASPQSLLKKSAAPPPLILKKGDQMPSLSRWGYQEKAFPERPGDFSPRGFLWDVFSPAYRQPLRLQLRGDELESLSLLSPDFKRRERALEEAWLPALGEWEFQGEDRRRLCQFIKSKGGGLSASSLFFPQSALLKSLSRGKTPRGFEALMNAGDETCSLDYFSRPPWLWIFEPEQAREAFLKEAAELEREDPLFARENVFLSWEILEGGNSNGRNLKRADLEGKILKPRIAPEKLILVRGKPLPFHHSISGINSGTISERPAAGFPGDLPERSKAEPLQSEVQSEGGSPAPVHKGETPARFPLFFSGGFFSRPFKMPKGSQNTQGAGPPAEKLKAALGDLPLDHIVFVFQDPLAERRIRAALFRGALGETGGEESGGGESGGEIPAAGAEWREKEGDGFPAASSLGFSAGSSPDLSSDDADRESALSLERPAGDSLEMGFWEGKSLVFLKGALEESFFTSDGTAYLKAEEILRAMAPEREASSFEFFQLRAKALDFSELEKGDLAVHRIHGVGEFSGLLTLCASGRQQDFFALLYHGGDKLLLPAYKAREIKRYSRKLSGGASAPLSRHLLDRLGNPKRWESKKARAKKHIEALTLDLMEIYRRRKKSFRPPFPSAAADLAAFAKDFPFEETPDQKKAIQEIFSDMDQSRPMDRLLCADVGFGKTEAALRAAFRALAGGFQVCFLAPTTVLSFQHYGNFQQRFKNFPFKLALFNRFLSAAKRQAISRRLGSGEIDFLIATHGVFSPKISFQRLGLLIIDEEHRFGVKQKERLLRLKKNLDTLALSATPIPRTLNMALSGVKDISVISHPPKGRLPVRTFIESWDGGPAKFLREACERERRRAGQILFVHNRVKSLPEREEQLRALLPDFRIASAHGQMKSADLEKTILRFFQREFDLLISTNIIESGTDLPHANTLFIDRVHEMGLSRLYQLKGRVGRGSDQAYCYFLIPSRRRLSAAASERLRLIEKYGEAGGGYRLALHDLEMRGAGALFGAEQSGHLHALGEDLYFEILNERLSEKKGGFVEPEISLPVSTGIPSDYIPDSRLRLLYYKSLSESESEESLNQIKREILEDFGPFPEEMENLFSLLKIRALCKKLLIRDLKARELKGGGRSLALAFHEKTAVAAEKIIEGASARGWQMESAHSVRIPLGEESWLPQIECLLREL